MEYSTYSGYRDNRPQSDVNNTYEDDKDYYRYSPKDTNNRYHKKPDTCSNSHHFDNNKERNINRKDNLSNSLPPKYFEIKPYLDNILSDQISDNKEVQRNLKDLKNLNERLLQDIGGSGHNRQSPPVKGSYWDEIQRLIMQIIDNSQNQTSEFKASLQHLKNIKNKALQQDLNYYQSDQSSYNHHQKVDRKPIYRSSNYHDERPVKNTRPFSQTFQPRTQNQYRLMDQIMALKQQNRELRRRLNDQVSKNRSLTHRLRDLEQDYGYSNHGRIDDRSQVNNGRDYRQYRQTQGRSSHRIRNSEPENSYSRGQPARDNIKNLSHHLNNLKSHAESSQKRAQQYQNLRNNQQYIVGQLNKLKYQNDGLRNDTADLLRAKSQPKYNTYNDIDNNRYKNLETSLAQHRNDYSGNNGYRNTLNGSRKNSTRYY